MELTETQVRTIGELISFNESAVLQLEALDQEQSTADAMWREAFRGLDSTYRRFEQAWGGSPLSHSYRYYQPDFQATGSHQDMVWLNEALEAKMRAAFPDGDAMRLVYQGAFADTQQALRRIVPRNASVRHLEGLDSAWSELSELLQGGWAADMAGMRNSLQPKQVISRFIGEDIRMMIPVHREFYIQFAYWYQSYRMVRAKPGKTVEILGMINASLPFARIRQEGAVPQVVINNENRQEDRRTTIGSNNEIAGTNAIGEAAAASAVPTAPVKK